MNAAKVESKIEKHIEDLINKAHQIISETSLFEFIDLDRETAKVKAQVLHPDLSEEEIERYLGILDLLRSLSE